MGSNNLNGPTPYKVITEVITLTDPYATGGVDLQSAELSVLNRATVLQNPTGIQGVASITTGQSFKLKLYWQTGASGTAFAEITDTYGGFSGSQWTLLMEGT